MDPHGVAVVADQVEAPVRRQLVIGYQIVNVNDASLPREVVRARVERLDVCD